MSADRKRSSVVFWAMVILLLPLLYVGSFGPACWIASRVDGDGGSFIAFAYQPLMRVWWGNPSLFSSPSWQDDLLVKYADIGSTHSWLFLPDDKGWYVPNVMPSAFY